MCDNRSLTGSASTSGWGATSWRQRSFGSQSGGPMPQLGIMATTFARPTLAATLDAVAQSGVHSVQFDLACAGGASLPEQIDAALCERVRQAFAARPLTIAA